MTPIACHRSRSASMPRWSRIASAAISPLRSFRNVDDLLARGTVRLLHPGYQPALMPDDEHSAHTSTLESP